MCRPKRLAQRVGATFLALLLAFSPLSPLMLVTPLAPTPAKASLADCWNATVDAIENGVEIVGLTVDSKFIECAGKVASMDVVSIAVDAAFTVWGALGEFNDNESCLTSVKETIVQPIYDLLSNIPSDVTSVIDGILAAGGELFVGIFNSIVGDAQKVSGDKLTLADIIAVGVDYLYQILEQAIPTVFDYIKCGCKMAGTALQVYQLTKEVADEVWQCAQTFCIVNCDDEPPPPKGGVPMSCAPGERQWLVVSVPPAGGCPDTGCQYVKEFYHPTSCNFCGSGQPGSVATEKTYSVNETVTLPFGGTVEREDARYSYCSCPEGLGYQQVGQDYVTDPVTGVSGFIPRYDCAPCPEYSSLEPDGKSCVSCGGGQGVVPISTLGTTLPVCQACGVGEGTLADGTCGTCAPGEGVFAGLCGQCPESAPRNAAGVCESCPPGTQYNPATGTCGPICTGGYVWGYDVKKKTNDCVPCGANTQAVYVDSTTGLATGGKCDECGTGYTSTAGQAVCTQIDCEHGLSTTGRSCASHCQPIELGLPGGGPVITTWVCEDSPLANGFPVFDNPCPSGQIPNADGKSCRPLGKSKGRIPWWEWRMQLEAKVQVLEKVNLNVQQKVNLKQQNLKLQDKTKGRGATGVQTKLKTEQTTKQKSKESFKTQAPLLELPGAGGGSQAPFPRGGPRTNR